MEHVHTFPDHDGVVSLPHLELIVPLLGQQSSNVYSTIGGIYK